MTGDLLTRVLEAHGGLDNWNEVTRLEARLSYGGPFWELRGWPQVYTDQTVTLDTHREHITFAPFTAPDRTSVLDVDPERVQIRSADGEVIEERLAPRASFPLPFDDFATQWDAVQVAYFTSAATWNYLTAPFVFTHPGVTAREIEPWDEQGETWRRLAVTFPPAIANHNADQTFYYDDRFMLRRMDYSPDVTGSPRIAHYTHDHRTFDGFVFPTRRCVHLHDEAGVADQGFAPITLDIEQVAVYSDRAASNRRTGATMSDDFDVIVIGGGSPGEHCAAAIAAGGLRVAIAERELLGGECSYWACIPSKTLLRSGEALAAVRDVPGANAAVTGALDPHAALAWRDFMVSAYDDAGQEAWARGEGIEVLRGTARLDGPGTVVVDGERHTSRHVVIATGSEPVIPPIPGLRALDGVWTSREATALTDIPDRLMVLGAGPVGVEMAQALARLGASVALVEGGNRVLSREPPAVGKAIGDALAADGVDLRLGHRATAARRDGPEYVLEFADGTELRADRLLVATGRRPRVEDLGLETVGVEADPMGLAVDRRLALGDGLWAIGDVTGVRPLTHVGKYQGRVVAANILGRERVADYTAVPLVVFTDPQAASVGETEGEYTATTSLAAVARTATYTRAYDTRPGFLTLVSDGRRLTGAYAVGPEAGEWLQQATVAIRARVPLAVLLDVIQPFPTFAEAFLHALRDLEAQTTADAAAARAPSLT